MSFVAKIAACNMNPVFKQLDPEAIRRVKLGIKPSSEVKPLKHQKPARKVTSYRAARRNEVLRGDPPTVWKGVAFTRGGYQQRWYQKWVDGKLVTYPKIYKPNGEQECDRRRRQRERRELAS